MCSSCLLFVIKWSNETICFLSSLVTQRLRLKYLPPLSPPKIKQSHNTHTPNNNQVPIYRFIIQQKHDTFVWFHEQRNGFAAITEITCF